MSAYTEAYNVAYDEALDYLVTIARDMQHNNDRQEGDVEMASEDAVLDLWKAIHGFGSPDSPNHDELWTFVRDAAYARVRNI